MKSFAIILVAAVMGMVTAATSAELDNVEQITLVKDKYPYWSPDGSKIVFESNRSGNDEIWVMSADGTDMKQLTDNPGRDESPVWTADGRYIVFASYRDGDVEIYRMKPDGSEQTNLSNHPSPDSHPKVSSDGRRIIFNSGRAADPALFSGEVMSHDMNHEIYEMDIDGGNVVRLTHHDDWDTYPSISPDGRKIAFRRVIVNSAGDRDSEVFVADRDGGNPTNLSNDVAFDGYPAWAASSDHILFASNREGIDDNDFNIYVIEIATGEITRLTHSPGYEDARPIASLDGRKLVFNRQIGGTGAMAIYIADIDLGD